MNGRANVTIRGIGFGTERGGINIGGETPEIVSWNDQSIVFTAPHVPRGKQDVVVTAHDGAKSAPQSLSFLESKLIPIRIAVKNPPLKPGQSVFISGNVQTLGNGKRGWSEAAGPMLASPDNSHILVVPLPAKQQVEYKLVILDKDGKVVQEESKPHSYRVPESGVWTNAVKWQP